MINALDSPLILDHIAEDITYVSHRTWRNQSNIEREASYLLASLQRTAGFYAGHQRQKLIISHTQLGTLKTTIMVSLVRQAH